MKLNQVNVGDIVRVNDWSYSVNPTSLKMDLSYYPYLWQAPPEPYEVVGKGRFPGERASGYSNKKVFNNLRIKSARNGNEYYVKSQFVSKIRKETK